MKKMKQISMTYLSLLDQKFVPLFALEKAGLDESHCEQREQQNTSDDRQSYYPSFNLARGNAPPQNYGHLRLIRAENFTFSTQHMNFHSLLTFELQVVSHVRVL
jgi:hypothetical protein